VPISIAAICTIAFLIWVALMPQINPGI
jgi:hypothetical protein